MKTLIRFIRDGRPARRCHGGLMALLCIASAISAQLLPGQEPISPGTVDSTFQSDIRRGHVAAVVVQPDGQLLVGGQFGIPGVGTNLVRFTPDGAPDPGFGPTSGAPWDPTKLALQPDGRLLVGNKGGVDGYYPWIGLSR